MSHTPGPWKPGHNPEDIASGDTLIAKVNPWVHEHRGNARLIAASPNLLDITEKYIALCTHCGLFQEAEDAKLLVARVRVGE